MKSEFSRKWNKSKKPSKQRKYSSQAPYHLKGKMMGAHLSKELRAKHNKRSARVIKGDKVKVTRGMFKGKTGAVESVNIKKQKVYVAGVEYTKKDGAKSKYPIHVSNVYITELKLDDKKRKQKLQNSETSKKGSDTQKSESTVKKDTFKGEEK